MFVEVMGLAGSSHTVLQGESVAYRNRRNGKQHDKCDERSRHAQYFKRENERHDFDQSVPGHGQHQQQSAHSGY
jgi:hypothetical protein